MEKNTPHILSIIRNCANNARLKKTLASQIPSPFPSATCSTAGNTGLCTQNNEHVQLPENWLKKITSCAGGRHNMPRPLQVDLWPSDFESGVQVTCDVGYLCASFSLPRPLCSRLRPDVCDRETDVRCASSLNAPYPKGVGITMITSFI